MSSHICEARSSPLRHHLSDLRRGHRFWREAESPHAQFEHGVKSRRQSLMRRLRIQTATSRTRSREIRSLSPALRRISARRSTRALSCSSWRSGSQNESSMGCSAALTTVSYTGSRRGRLRAMSLCAVTHAKPGSCVRRFHNAAAAEEPSTISTGASHRSMSVGISSRSAPDL